MNARVVVVVSVAAVVLLAACDPTSSHPAAPTTSDASAVVQLSLPPAPVPSGKVSAPALPHLGGLNLPGGGGFNGVRVPRVLRRLGQKGGQ